MQAASKTFQLPANMPLQGRPENVFIRQDAQRFQILHAYCHFCLGQPLNACSLFIPRWGNFSACATVTLLLPGDWFCLGRM